MKRANYATIEGVAVVTIPVSHYAELLESRRRLGETSINHQQLFKPRRSVIDRNPEVAVFFAQNLGLKPVRELVQDCRRLFGKKRTPSIKSAYRYWQRLREEASTPV